MDLESREIESLTIDETFCRLWDESKLAYQAAAGGRSADLQTALDARDKLLSHATKLASEAKPHQIAAVLEYAERIRKLDPEVESRLLAQQEHLKRELQMVRRGKALAGRYLRPKIRTGGAIFGRDA